MANAWMTIGRAIRRWGSVTGKGALQLSRSSAGQSLRAAPDPVRPGRSAWADIQVLSTEVRSCSPGRRSLFPLSFELVLSCWSGCSWAGDLARNMTKLKAG